MREEIYKKGINDNKYKNYKEKIFSRTLKLSPNYSHIIKNIVSNYTETAEGYKGFLLQNLNLLVQLFSESKSENLRILKALLADFERVFVTWNKTKVPKEYMPQVLYSFGAVSFEIKSGKYEKIENGYLSAKNEARKKYSSFNSHGSDLFALYSWIKVGVWNEDEFISEIKSKYCPNKPTHDEKFLLYNFWELQQEDIDRGLPVALDNAYKGELSRDDLISLLTKIHALKEYNIKISCEIDYSKIESGLEIRKNRIKLGEATEPAKRTFATKDQIDSEAVKINDIIEAMDEFITATENRNKYIAYLLQQNENLHSYSFKGVVLSSFDDNLLNLFIEKYMGGNNHLKRELALSLINLNFGDIKYSDKNEMSKSIINFRELADTLDQINKNEPDQMSIAINNCFIKEINKKILLLEEMLQK